MDQGRALVTHEHFWEIEITSRVRGLWDITWRDRIVGSDWNGRGGFALVDSKERLLKEIAPLAERQPACKCGSAEPRYYTVNHNGDAEAQPAGSKFEYDATDHSIAFTGPTGIIGRRYPRGSWQSVVFK